MGVSATVQTAVAVGIDVLAVTVTVTVEKGPPSRRGTWSFEGWPDPSSREAAVRVRTALSNGDVYSPEEDVRVVLSERVPASRTPGLDLAVAVAYWVARGDIDVDLSSTLVVGELSLGGEVRRVPGILPVAAYAAEKGLQLRMPAGEAWPPPYTPVGEVWAAAHLSDFLSVSGTRRRLLAPMSDRRAPDFTDLHGMEEGKRALQVAAAGGFDLLLEGPPGCGKTMLARRAAGVLATGKEDLRTAAAWHSAAGVVLSNGPPFRAPHHTISAPGMAGSVRGGVPLPGERTLAHGGVLYLDELLEFSEEVVEIAVGRGTTPSGRPAMVIAAYSACACLTVPCKCDVDGKVVQRRRAKARALLPNALRIHLPRVPYSVLATQRRGEVSEMVRARVRLAQAKARDVMGRLPAEGPLPRITSLRQQEMVRRVESTLVFLDGEIRESHGEEAERYVL